MKAGVKLSATENTIYTATSAKEAISVFIVNTDKSNPADVTLKISGAEFFAGEVRPNTTVQITGIILDSGDVISGFASIANAVSVVVLGVER